MRRILLSAALLLAAPAPALAQWGEAPPVGLGARTVATCLRDAGGGRVAALAQRGKQLGTTLYSVGPEGLSADGEALLGRWLDDCPAIAVAESGAAVAAAAVRPGGHDRPGPARLMVGVRDAGGEFAPAVELARLSTGQATIEPAVAVGAGGSMLVAWIERHDVFPRERERVTVRVAQRLPGAGFGVVQTLVANARSGDIEHVGLAAALDDSGRATLAWARPLPPRSHGTIDRLASIEIATAAPGAPFGAPQVVAGETQDTTTVALAVAPDGRALLAHDGNETVRVYERAGGDVPFGADSGIGGDPRTLPDGQTLVPPGDAAPAVALARDGGAVVAWRAGNAVDAVARAAWGAFGPVRRLQRQTDEGDLGFSSSLVFSGAMPVDTDDGRLRVAAAPGGLTAAGWVVPGGPAGAAASARVALVSEGGRAVALGTPSRDVGAVLPRLGPAGPAAIWADNRTRALGADFPVGDGRLHLAQAARASSSPDPPALTASARPQRLYHGEPLVVRARCAAACDLRATIAPRPSRGEADYDDGGPPGAAIGVGGRADAGLVRLLVEPAWGNHVAPPRRRTVRVVVTATAPGGTHASRTVVHARVSRRPIPPLQPPLDVQARRTGDAVVVTWRTAGPARRMSFLAFTRRTRGKSPAHDSVHAQVPGRGHQRFRVRLRHARGMRWAVLYASAIDPPSRFERVVVRISR